MTRNMCIPVKNALWAVIPCEGELFVLYEKESSVSLCLFTAVHKFDSRPAKN
jgi:hypothetical protein